MGLQAVVPAAVLMVVLVASPSTHAACQEEVTGTVLLPTGLLSPLATSRLHDVTVFYVTDLASGTGYDLRAVAPVSTSCVAGECLANPDFNVMFVQDAAVFDTAIAHHTTPGNQQGAIPHSADAALIYMRNGPDVPDGDGSPGARFVFSMGCTASAGSDIPTN